MNIATLRNSILYVIISLLSIMVIGWAWLYVNTTAISRSEIISNLPQGLHRSDVETYLMKFPDEFTYEERERYSKVPIFPWAESEKGIYTITFRNIRERWWSPALGSNLVVRIGISVDEKVTQVDMYTYGSGYL